MSLSRRGIVDIAIVMAIVAIGFYARNYYAQFFRGPLLVQSDDELLKLASTAESQRRTIWIELRDRALIPTNIEAVGTSNGAVYSKNPYQLLTVNDRVLLVLTLEDADGRQLAGPLQPVSGRVDREVWQSIHDELGDDASALLPVILNAAAAYTVFGYLGLAVGVMLTLFVMLDLARALRWRRSS